MRLGQPICKRGHPPSFTKISVSQIPGLRSAAINVKEMSLDALDSSKSDSG